MLHSACWQRSSVVEQRTHKPLVGGSNPPAATSLFDRGVSQMKKLLESTYGVFLTLGIAWFIVGFVIYGDSNIWPLGFLFLIIGLIGLVSKKRKHQ